MGAAVALAIASLAVTLIVGFTTIGRTLGRIELKVDTMWNSFVDAGAWNGPERRHGGRAVRDVANDHPAAHDEEPET